MSGDEHTPSRVPATVSASVRYDHELVRIDGSERSLVATEPPTPWRHAAAQACTPSALPATMPISQSSAGRPQLRSMLSGPTGWHRFRCPELSGCAPSGTARRGQPHPIRIDRIVHRSTVAAITAASTTATLVAPTTHKGTP